ncbi:MAG: Zn-ribbon containing protein [Candidatus Pacearchaeota archaeon]
MGHQCTHCGKIYPDASQELLTGCSCGARFFYYIKQEKIEQLERETQNKIELLNRADKIQVEKDIREITGLDEEPDKPVILDLESIKILEPGKFEIDIINLFSRNRPLIYKLEEGKYIIDLSSSLKVDTDEINKKIRNPDLLKQEERERKEEEK